MKMQDANDHRVMLDATKAWMKIKETGQQMWGDWTTKVGPALAKARAEAMRLAETNQPKGKGYSQSMSALLLEYRLDDIEQGARADLLKLMEHLSTVEQWRNKQGQRESLNHLTTVWRQFKNSEDWKALQMSLGLRQPDPPDPEGIAALKKLDKKHLSAKELADKDAALANAHGRIQELESQLESARAQSLDRSIDAAMRLPADDASRIFGDSLGDDQPVVPDSKPEPHDAAMGSEAEPKPKRSIDEWMTEINKTRMKNLADFAAMIARPFPLGDEQPVVDVARAAPQPAANGANTANKKRAEAEALITQRIREEAEKFAGAEIAELTERLAARDARIAEIEGELAATRGDLAVAQARIAELEAQLKPKSKPRRLKWTPTSKKLDRYTSDEYSIVRTRDTESPLYALYCGETLVVADTDLQSAKGFAQDHARRAEGPQATAP
jgi:hypothetical protein